MKKSIILIALVLLTPVLVIGNLKFDFTSNNSRILSIKISPNVKNIDKCSPFTTSVDSLDLVKDKTKAQQISLRNEVTKEIILYNRVTSWLDMSKMDNSKVDDIVYIKRGNNYYKREFSGPVHIKWFGAKGDGIADDTKQIQKAFDSKYNELFFDKGTYLVSKNTDLVGFPNNDQPCLLINERKNLNIDGNNAVIIVKEHGQGILELQKSTNVTINGLNVVGAGKFPKLDGNTGNGEKGIKNSGYYTAGSWGYYKNNSHNTSLLKTGGYNGRFPQFNGGYGATWGIWNGGYIGNVSYGILIHNLCSNITLNNCSAKMFNYVGIGVGHNGDYFPKALNYPYSENIVFNKCIAEGNYEAGFHSMAVRGFKLINSESYDSGHPNASLTDKTCDPGYGYTSRNSAHYTEGALIENSIFKNNMRKGLDVHSGKGITFSNNYVYGSRVCGIFAAWSAFDEKTIDIKILNNKIENCGFGPSALGGIYLGGHGNDINNGRILNAVVRNNIITNYSRAGITVRYGNNVTIENNKLIDSKKGVMPNLSSILILGKSATDFVNNIVVKDNVITDGSLYMPRGIQVSNATSSTVQGNSMSFEKDINIGLFVSNSDSINVLNNNVLLKGKGQGMSIPIKRVRKQSNTINGKQEL